MQKLVLSVAALGVLVVGAVAAGMSSSTATVTTWDMPTPYPDGTFHTVNIKRFAEEVRQATGGRLVIQVHSAGSLFKHPEIKNAVRAAQVPIGEFLLSQLANQNALFEVDAVPFLATDYDQAARLWEISRPHVEALLGQEGLIALYSIPWPPQGLYADQPVRAHRRSPRAQVPRLQHRHRTAGPAGRGGAHAGRGAGHRPGVRHRPGAGDDHVAFDRRRCQGLGFRPPLSTTPRLGCRKTSWSSTSARSPLSMPRRAPRCWRLPARPSSAAGR